MKSECKNYIEAILADNPEQCAVAHCGDCTECASLASDWQRMRNTIIPAGEVPLSLDFAVLAAADSALKRRMHRKITIRRIIYYGAAAACVALACLITIFPPNNSSWGHGEIVKKWDWSKFDKELFEMAAAIEVTSYCISISGKPDNADAAVPNLPVIEDGQDNI